MPQTELKVVRCPGCNTAYNAASLPPGKGFKCKKCSTVVGGSAPTPEPAQTKRPSTRLDRQASTGSTSRRMKPEARGERGEKPERPASGRARGGAPQQKSPVLYIVGGVMIVAIIGLMAATMGGDDKPQPKKTEEPAPEPPKAQKPPEDDIANWDLGGHETDFAKQRKRGSSGQDMSKIDPLTGQGVTDDPPKAPEEEQPPKDPLEDELQPENKDQ